MHNHDIYNYLVQIVFFVTTLHFETSSTVCDVTSIIRIASDLGLFEGVILARNKCAAGISACLRARQNRPPHSWWNNKCAPNNYL